MAYSRRLFFFDQTTLCDSQEDDPCASFGDAHPVCYTSGRGFLWIGDSDGLIHRFNRAFQTTSFRAHSSCVRHAFQLKEHDILLTVGIDDTTEELLKVWNVGKWTTKPTPFCSRCTHVSPTGQPTSTVTCLYVHENLQFIVLGHAGGHVQLFRGDLTRERNFKRQLVHTFSTAVTGVGLDIRTPRSSTPSEIDQSVIVFATSEQCIMSFVFGKREDAVSKTLLDRFGAGRECSIMLKQTPDSPQYAVARSDAIYFYNWDGRGPCLATDGNKLALTVFRQYLVIAKGQSLIGSGPALPQTRQQTTASSVALADPVCVTVHDQQNKFIAGEFFIPGFQTMFVEWDGIYIIRMDTASDGCAKRTLVCLTEKCTQAKLEMLFSKKNFQLAVDIAKCQNMTKEQMAQIHWRYADHLYKQKEYDAAVNEYVKTVGILEVSFVIQRFLEGGHISQLAHYLEALNAAGLASSDHLVLLLNCYARLQDHNRLSQFVKEPINPQLNISSALQMLRQFGFPQIALQLAKSSGRYADQISIALEDLDDSEGALSSISQFPFDDALKAICNYGHVLIERMPTETVQLLDRLCSHPDACRINVHHFLKIFINNRRGLMQFLERYVSNVHESIKVTGMVDALLELALYELSQVRSDEVNRTALSAQRTKEQLSKMILDLLHDTKLPYDEKKALMLCHRRGFFEACVYLWEKLKLYDQLIKHYMDLNQPKEILNVCQRFGKEMPKLWLLALRYFASKPECPDELRVVISEIDQQNLASPMTVIQILSDTDEEHSCQVGTIRDYLLRHLEAETNYISTLQQEVEELRNETTHNREVVRALNSEVKVFQQRKCALCHQSLDLPSVHFLCDHSYHALCFENYAYGDQQCPECAPKNKKLLAETTKAASLGLKPEQVFDQLRVALHPDHMVFDSNGTSLSKNIAGRIIINNIDSLSTTITYPRSPVNSSPIQTANSTLPKDVLPVGSHVSTSDNPTCDATLHFAGGNVSSVPATVHSKSTSVGYHSATSADANLPGSATSRVPFNPFDNRTNSEVPPDPLSTIEPSNRPSSASDDLGLGRSTNPFDSD